MKKTQAVRSIVITGATRGLGRGLARYYDRAGFSVFCCGRSESTVAALQAQLSPAANVARVDVGNDQAVHSWAREILSVGVPRLVCHCAGTLPPRRPFVEIPAERLSLELQTNVIGAANVARAFLPGLMSAGSGTLVCMASNPDGFPLQNLSAYAVCKAAMEKLWQALAEEARGSGAGVVSLYPGMVHTDMLEKSLGEAARDYPDADAWAEKAAPFLLELGPEQNGRHISAPA